jgi:uncharacterized protein
MSLQVHTPDGLKTDKLAFFRFKKFDDKSYLLTNDAGKFHFLSIEDFNTFVSWDVESLSSYKELLSKGFIKSSEYEQKMVWSYALRSSHVWLWPVLHIVITTLRCNHHCKYCHAAVAPMTAKDVDMSLETAEKVLDTIFFTNSNSLTIEFQWWESLVNWEVVQYMIDNAIIRWQYLKKAVSFSLVTNLTLMTEEKLSRLMEKNVGISTSLDGDEKNHNNNRTWFDGNSFDKVTYWIKRINEEYERRKMETRVWALLTVTKENLSYYKDLIDSYVGLWLQWIFLRWLNPYWFAASDLKNLSYTKEEWLDFYKKSMDYIIEINKKWIKFKESITTVYLMKILWSQEPNFMDIRSPSWLAIWCVAYSYDGKIYASDESRMLGRMWIQDFLMTELKESWEATYKSMMESELTKISVQSSCLDGLPGYNEHVYKPYIWVDIIHNFKVTGSLYTPLVKDEKMFLQIWILDYIFDKISNDAEAKEILYSWVQ